MNVPVEDRHRTEAFEHRQRLLAVRGSPTPLWIHGPQGNVREHDNRRTGRKSPQVLLQPVKLLLSDLAQSFELGHVIQSHKMNSFVIEAVPAPSGRALAEPFEVLPAVVSCDIMLARHIEHLPLAQALQE